MKAVSDTYNSCTDDSLEINSVVLIETFILDGNKSITHILGNFVIFLVYTVGIRIFKLFQHGSVLIYNGCRIPLRKDILSGNFRCIINDMLDKHTTCGNTDDPEQKDAQNKCLK